MTSSIDSNLGVIGGGQLCRMMGEDAAPLGVVQRFMDPTPNAPGAPVSTEQYVGEFDDKETMLKLAEVSDCLTFEIELADSDALEYVQNHSDTPVHPRPATLRMIEDKYNQKETLREHGIPVPSFRKIDSEEDLEQASEQFGFPMMLKARQGGYDGRGNLIVKREHDPEERLRKIGGPAMVEEFIPYDRELSVMGVIGREGNDTFPVTETIHEEQILRRTITPARTNQEVRERAQKIALDVLELMQGRGVYGIELFENDGEIFVNEIAPRPHNSGHWTIEGAYTSQFEQHVRAVLGLPLGSTELIAPAVSGNILGSDPETSKFQLTGTEEILNSQKTSLHWYGKRKVWSLRKMGHVTMVGDNRESMNDQIQSLLSELTFDHART